MSVGGMLATCFEKFPEVPMKNSLRYFFAFNRFVPAFISNLLPVKGYELHYQLKENDIVVDVGAYPGDYAIFAGRKVGNGGKVICFEPNPENRKILIKNIEHGELKNVIIIPKGLWNENTILKIKEDELSSSVLTKNGQTIIDVVRLDDELEKLGIEKIDFLKMDIEGAEIEAIEGCRKILKKSNSNVAIASYHVVDGKTTSEFIENFLIKLGYNVKSDFPKHLTTYGWKK